MATVKTDVQALAEAIEGFPLSWDADLDILDVAAGILDLLPENCVLWTDVARYRGVLEEAVAASVADTGRVLPKRLTDRIEEILEEL